MSLRVLESAAHEIAIEANASYDRMGELEMNWQVKLLEMLQKLETRENTTRLLGVTFATADYDQCSNSEFYVAAALHDAEQVRFEALCDAVGRTLDGREDMLDYARQTGTTVVE